MESLLYQEFTIGSGGYKTTSESRSAVVFQIPGASRIIYLRRCPASITEWLKEVLTFEKGIILRNEFTAFKQAGKVLLRCW